MIGAAKGSIGYLVENELNITETLSDWLDKIKPIYDLKTDIDNISTSLPITTSLDLLTDANDTTIEQSNINDMQSTSDTNNTSDGETNFYDSSTTVSYKESFADVTSTTQSLSYLNKINLNSLYFTGILFHHIQFDDKYWLNGFEFEALNDGWIKIGVFVLSIIYFFKLLFKYN